MNGDNPNLYTVMGRNEGYGSLTGCPEPCMENERLYRSTESDQRLGWEKILLFSGIENVE